MEFLTVCAARRLALARAGLLKPEWTGLPRRAAGSGKRARTAAQAIIDRFGYLQLDTVSIAGARSHVLVLLSRLEGFAPELGEQLLQPGAPIFEYWGHEASWIPLDLYTVFSFRRRAYKTHPWWGNLIEEHPEVAKKLVDRIRDEGPMRSMDMDGQGSSGWWDLKLTKKVATALWSNGELAISTRHNFQRTYDLVERVIPAELRNEPRSLAESVEVLLLRALKGHGWATTGTLAATWRLRNLKPEITAAMARLVADGQVIPCELENPEGRTTTGWIRPEDLDLAARLLKVRPRHDRGVLLSPFDPVLWDRTRVARLFSFDQVLEIFKPASQRMYGYYCLPVLAGDRLVARVDLKADRKAGVLHVLSSHFEAATGGSVPPVDREAVRSALVRHSRSLNMEIGPVPA